MLTRGLAVVAALGPPGLRLAQRRRGFHRQPTTVQGTIGGHTPISIVARWRLCRRSRREVMTRRGGRLAACSLRISCSASLLNSKRQKLLSANGRRRVPKILESLCASMYRTRLMKAENRGSVSLSL
jgi:hypothetical protein